MDPRDARIRTRDAGLDRLNELTTWIAAGALAAVGAFGVIAAETIPGAAAPTANSNGSTGTASANTSSSTGTSLFHHHHDYSGSVSSSSSPPMAVTGGSR